MSREAVIVGAALTYLGLLFAIAYYADRRADAGRSVIANPIVYTLSIAIYCTAWTFYGSVGRAAETGVGFLPIYLGPTLCAVLFWVLLRRIVRISKAQRITSIADFIASRYGKSPLVGGLVTVIAVVGIMPYISIQLEAIAISFDVLSERPAASAIRAGQPLWADSSFYTALLLIVFTVLFGTRHVDNTERHEGLVAAVAFESVVKLVAFIAAGLYVSYGLFDGLGDIFTPAAADPRLARLLSFEAVPGGYGGWLSLTFIAMAAFLFLPRQFQILVVENVNEAHLRKASWLFPLYLLAINVFVLPIAVGGLQHFAGRAVDADTFVLALPLANGQHALAMLVFLGGLSAATGMVVVASVALATMVCNDLVVPLLLRQRWLGARSDLSGLLLSIRRAAIALVILLGYLFFRLIGELFPLVTVGLLSFAAAAQFAPAILFGIYWRRASRVGALLGLSGGFLVWLYTLLLPLSGWLEPGVIESGPWGIALLSPHRLFGLQGLDPVTHAVFWSMLVNVGGLVCGSLLSRQSAVERIQASRFVDVFEHTTAPGEGLGWRGSTDAEVAELRRLVGRFIGVERASRAFSDYARRHRVDLDDAQTASPALLSHAEQLLAGAIGTASARVMIASVVKGESLGIGEIMTILDESSQAIRYSKQLEQQSRELEIAYAELREVNARLTELDRLKDEFVSTVSHELRTPLTSIRGAAEILRDNPQLGDAERGEFLAVMVKESERLTRLINQMLDMSKMESGHLQWQRQPLDLAALVRDAVGACRQLFQARGIAVEVVVEKRCEALEFHGDGDRLTQVMINLLSNAAKFSAEDSGRVAVRLKRIGDDNDNDERARIEVQDNGPGIPDDQREQVFDRFHQVNADKAGKPQGSGLGLSISRHIIEHHGGRIWVRAGSGGDGATFVVELPLSIEPY